MKRSETRSVEQPSNDPVESPHSNATNLSPVGEVRLSLNGHNDEADMEVARRHVLETCCTIYDSVSDTYKWRSITKTNRQEMGDYGLGVHLYFDFMNVISIVLAIMAVVCTPLLVVNYCGDFAGVAASFFAKLTIGNIGYCGDYGQLCPDINSFQYRTMLLNNPDILLREVTPYFGAASCVAIGIFGLASLYYYYIRLPRIAKEYNDKHITPTDFSIEVDYLPKILPGGGNADYEGVLRRHFECIVGREGCVAEVALSREYDGAIRTFLRIGELDIEIRENKARLKVANSENEADKLRNHVYHLEKLKEECEKKVEEQALVPEEARAVVKAFVIFSETRYQKRVLETYKWSRQGPLMRMLQSRSLQFMGHAIYVREACEPGNLYQENLDVSKREVFLRTLFTVCASICVLIFTAILLVITQTATRGADPSGIGAKSVWIIANATSTNSSLSTSCWGPCGVSFYSDVECTASLSSNISGLLGSSGVYVPGVPVIASTDLSNGSSTCSETRNWNSDRCTAISGGNEVLGIDNLTVSPSVMYLNSTDTLIASLSTLPSSSSPCGLMCSNGDGPILNICYSVAQTCDGVWNCPLGDDEAGCSNAVCNSTTQWQCPQSRRCVDQMFGTCGAECDSNASTTCQDLNNRVSLGALTVCDPVAVNATLTNTYGGVCTGFYADPCCTMTQLSSADRTELNCQFTNDIGDSALEWMSNYCLSFKKKSSSLCPSSLISTLLAISPNCQAAVVHNRRWCECVADATLLEPTDKNSLESCNVESTDWLYLGSQTRPGRFSSVLDTARVACQESLYFRSSNDSLFVSPLVVLGYTFTTTNSSSNISAAVGSAIGQNISTISVVGVQIGNNTGMVRIEVSDRTNTTSVAGWTSNVASASAEVDLAVSTLLGVSSRIVTNFEPHCDASHFQCPTTRACIPFSAICDGVPDCSIPLLNSVETPDESAQVCPNLSLTVPNVTTNLCLDNQFMCASQTQCIPDLFWCDGQMDCTDDSDETSADCLVQVAARNATKSISSITVPWETPEYLAFAFSSPVNVQCIKIDQPTANFANSIIVYACDTEVVFREGFGTVLRSPELSCTKLQTSEIGPPSSNVAATTSGVLYYDVLPPVQLACTNSTSCPLLTGNYASYCDSTGHCGIPQNGTISSLAVMQTPQCDYSSPISPVVAESIRRSYTVNGTVSDTILSDMTYTCFCDQQLQYNYVSDPFFIFPPYSSDIQQTCDVYYTNLLTQKGWMFVGIIAVAFLNFVLRMLMYFLADFERAYSLTDKAGSEMWKLFLAQFVNTAILVLVVNANFYGAVSWGLAGLGTGDYSDTTKDWFVNIGSSLCITLLILVGTNIVPTWLLDWGMSKLKNRWAKQCLTQEAMNKTLEKDDFLLSLRLAQTINLTVCVIMYFSGMPLVLWVGVLYAVCGYWFDKYFLLRCSKIPPQYSEGSIKICLRLLPIALIANCAFMVWTFGNQVVFPSDVVDQTLYDTFAVWGESETISYMLGRSTFTNETMYVEYISSRIVDSLRKAPFGGLLILLATVGFIALVLMYVLFSKTIWALVQVCLFPCRKPASFVRDKTRGFFGLQVPSDDPPFQEAKLEMIKQRVISSYKIQENPRYAKAYIAISKLKIRSEKRSQRLKSEVKLSSPSRIGPKPGIGSSEVRVVSPEVSRIEEPSQYPTISPVASRIGSRIGLGPNRDPPNSPRS